MHLRWGVLSQRLQRQPLQQQLVLHTHLLRAGRAGAEAEDDCETTTETYCMAACGMYTAEPEWCPRILGREQGCTAGAGRSCLPAGVVVCGGPCLDPTQPKRRPTLVTNMLSLQALELLLAAQQHAGVSWFTNGHWPSCQGVCTHVVLLAVDVLVPVVLKVVGRPPGQVVLCNVAPLVAIVALRLRGGWEGRGQGCEACCACSRRWQASMCCHVRQHEPQAPPHRDLDTVTAGCITAAAAAAGSLGLSGMIVLHCMLIGEMGVPSCRQKLRVGNPEACMPIAHAHSTCQHGVQVTTSCGASYTALTHTSTAISHSDSLCSVDLTMCGARK